MNWGAGEWGVGIMNYELGRGEKGAESHCGVPDLQQIFNNLRTRLLAKGRRRADTE